jgi:putative ABC transport system substrate-binding protein
MKKRVVRWIMLVVVLLVSKGMCNNNALAADRDRPFLIGALNESWGITPHEIGLRDGLLELGYRENQDFAIGSRFVKGDIIALRPAARELIQFGADLIFAVTSRATAAAKKETTQLPIVFAGGAVDPVKMSLVESYARPGGNVTGVADLAVELGPKRLQLFRQMIPELKRVLYPYHATDEFALEEVKAYRHAARSLGLELVEKPVTTEAEAHQMITAVRKGDVDGIVAPRCCGLNISGFVLEAATRQGIPTFFPQLFWVERGALASYGPDYYASGRQAARLVDKIIKGESPAQLPVEVNSKIVFAINRKAEKALGLTIAPEVLFSADRIIR